MANNNIYIIPDNFIEGGKIFNGMFKIRNLIEAVMIGLLIGFPMWQIPYPSIQMRVTVMVVAVAPIMMIAIIGINDDSLIEFLMNFWHWRKNKRIMLYNTKIQAREVRAADVVEIQEKPRDKFIDTIDSIKEKRRKATQTVFIEDEDFIFIEDEPSSGYVAAENKILGIETSKKSRKKKPKKNKLLLADKNKVIENDDFVAIELDNDNNDNNNDNNNNNLNIVEIGEEDFVNV